MVLNCLLVQKTHLLASSFLLSGGPENLEEILEEIFENILVEILKKNLAIVEKNIVEALEDILKKILVEIQEKILQCFSICNCNVCFVENVLSHISQ